jgi:SAM-dependent methyltransferase
MPTSFDRAGAEIRPISHTSTNDKVFEMVKDRLAPGVRLLDLGAGEGYFSKVIGDHVASRFGADPSDVISACDVTPEIYRYPAVRCDGIGSDSLLPYADDSFDIVCSLEVIEHVQDQFLFCRELLRVLKPGGTAVLSTPNVLNLNSRYRTLHSGFATLFNPLSLSSVDVVHTSGHIHPISYYYLAYALTHAGARSVTVEFDRFKRSAAFLFLFAWPFLLLGNIGFRTKLGRKNPKLLAENEAFLREMQSFGMLTSRSVVVRVTK